MAAAVMGLGGCADGADDSVAVHVGRTAITNATVKRWMSALAGGRLPADRSTRRALQAQALSFLISSQWLLGEAGEDGIRLSGGEVQRQFAQKRSTSFPGGAVELREFIKATGQSVSDLMFEAKAELASAKIRELLASREPAITQAQVVGYYDRHTGDFLIPERREVEIIALKSPADVRALKRQVQSGRSFASAAKWLSKREWIELPPRAYSPSLGKDATLGRAIHFARPHIPVGPILVHGIDRYVFEVMRIASARQQTLAQVQGSITRKLAAKRQRHTLTAFIEAWRRKWTARTSCSPDYVVQKCRQYGGPMAPEDPLALD